MFPWYYIQSDVLSAAKGLEANGDTTNLSRDVFTDY